MALGYSAYVGAIALKSSFLLNDEQSSLDSHLEVKGRLVWRADVAY